MKKILLIVGIVLLFSGCAANNIGGLYWGDYSATLYEFKKNPTDVTRAEHVESLVDVIEKSKKQGLRVPPGVYAELGSMYLEEGKTSEGSQYLQEEVNTYPESQRFISIIQGRVNQSQGT